MREFLIKEQSRILILIHRLMYIISYFVSSFLLIYFLKLTNWNLKLISLQYVVQYATLTFGFYIIGTIITKRNILSTFKLGILAQVGYLAIILFMGQGIKDYIIVLGVIKGISDAMYWVPRHYLICRLNRSKSAKKFYSVDYTIAKFQDIILPLIMGSFIGFTAKGYAIILFIMISVLIVAYIVAGWLNLGEEQVEPLKFEDLGTFIHSKNIGKIKKMYISELFNGITTGGVLVQVVTMLIFLVYKSEFGLGAYNAVLALITAIITFLMGQYLKDERFEDVLILSSIFTIGALILLTIKVEYITLIIYSIVTGITFTTINIIGNANIIKLMRDENVKKYTLEGIALRETSINVGRIIGYLVLYNLDSLSDNIGLLKLMLIFLTICIFARVFEMINSLKERDEHTLHALDVIKYNIRSFKFLIKKHI